VRFLATVELGLLAPQPALGLGHLHPFTSAKPDQVGLDYVDSPGPSSRMRGRMKRFPMVELWPFAVRVHQTRLCARDAANECVPRCGVSARVSPAWNGQRSQDRRGFTLSPYQPRLSVMAANIPNCPPHPGSGSHHPRVHIHGNHRPERSWPVGGGPMSRRTHDRRPPLAEDWCMARLHGRRVASVATE